MSTSTSDEEKAALGAALTGDHDAFMRAVGPYRSELHRHCYRMTGSLDDADDILQETLFRAWRGLGTYAGRSSFRAWLYRIATNRSIDALGGKARAEVVTAWEGQEDGMEPLWLQPYPDDPAEVSERREHIATAFVVAIQRLPPRQRAALLLKDVLGYSVPDTAAALETTVAGVNSALQRARAALKQDSAPKPTSDAETDLRDQLIDAWNRADLDALAALMARDVVMTMPPVPMVLRGPTELVDFLANDAPYGGLANLTLVPAAANRQAAAALYRPDPDGTVRLGAVMTLDVDGGAITRITAVQLPTTAAVRFGLPERLDAPAA